MSQLGGTWRIAIFGTDYRHRAEGGRIFGGWMGSFEMVKVLVGGAERHGYHLVSVQM